MACLRRQRHATDPELTVEVPVPQGVEFKSPAPNRSGRDDEDEPAQTSPRTVRRLSGFVVHRSPPAGWSVCSTIGRGVGEASRTPACCMHMGPAPVGSRRPVLPHDR